MLKVRLFAKYIFLFQAYSSLGQDGPTSDLFQSETVLNVAKSLDRTIPQVLLRWGLNHGYSVLPKSKNPDHIIENFNVSILYLFDKIKLGTTVFF